MAPTISPEDHYKFRRGIYAIRKDSNYNPSSNRSVSVINHIGKTQLRKRLNRNHIQRKSSISSSSSDDEENIVTPNLSIGNSDTDDYQAVNYISPVPFCNTEECRGDNCICADSLSDDNCQLCDSHDTPTNKFEYKRNVDEILSSGALISTLSGTQFQKSKLYKRQSRSTKGLFDIAIKTIQLIKRNELLQRRLTQLQVETKEFIDSVMSNPENSELKIKIEKQESNQSN